MNIVDQIVWAPLPTANFVNETFPKHQILLHHTAGNADPYSVIEYWKSNNDKVATAFIIGGKAPAGVRWKEGGIYQCFNSAQGAWHLGLTLKDLQRGDPGHQTSTNLNMQAIGIEICNYGYLVEKAAKWVTYDGTIMPEDQIVELAAPYRGYSHYQKYTDAQIESVRQLVLYLCDKYQIDQKYKGIEMFDVDPRALRGENGIWTHTSFRPVGEKWDCFPQPELVQMLESL